VLQQRASGCSGSGALASADSARGVVPGAVVGCFHPAANYRHSLRRSLLAPWRSSALPWISRAARRGPGQDRGSALRLLWGGQPPGAHFASRDRALLLPAVHNSACLHRLVSAAATARGPPSCGGQGRCGLWDRPCGGEVLDRDVGEVAGRAEFAAVAVRLLSGHDDVPQRLWVDARDSYVSALLLMVGEGPAGFSGSKRMRYGARGAMVSQAVASTCGLRLARSW